MGSLSLTLTVFFGLLSLALSIILFQRARHRKRLTFTHDLTGLYTRTHPEITIAFKGKQIDNLSRLRVVVWNSGNQEIRRSDIPTNGEPSITLAGATLRSVAVLDASPNTKCTAFERGDKTVSIDFEFLNPNDYATLDVLYESVEPQPQFQFTARIIGGMASENRQFIEPVAPIQWIGPVALALIWCGGTYFWVRAIPADFILSVKVPQVITHEKVLAHCHIELKQFVETMGILGGKLGPMVLQFPFFDKGAFKSQTDFLDRLIPFLKKLPQDHSFAVEIRNREWLDAQFAGVLRDFQVALVLQDQSRMPHPNELSQQFDPITTDWTYIRWLGDRKGIERITTTWNKTVIDRTNEITPWVDVCYETVRRGVKVFGYANNHYGGHAPATIRQFRELWRVKGLPEIGKQFSEPLKERTLFDL